MTIRTLSRWLAWGLIAAIVIVTLAPIELRPTSGLSANRERFASFALIGGLLCIGYPRHRLLVIVLAVGLAGLLELAQHVAPSRHARLRDGIIKAAGAFLGGAAAVIVDRRKAQDEARS